MVLMPDNASSLPQIPEQESAQALPPQGVSVASGNVGAPRPNGDLASKEHTALVPQKPRVANLKVVALLVLVLVVLCGAVYVYFAYLPKVQAQSFAAETYEDFNQLQNSLESIKSNKTIFSDVSQSLEISRGAFYEISQLKNYSDAVGGTKQDLENIGGILSKVEDAKKGKGKYRAASDLKPLNGALSSYYDRIEDGMKRLYARQDFQMKLLEAKGESYSSELDRMFSVYNTSTPRQGVSSYFSNLSTLCNEALTRMNGLSAPPDDISEYYNITFDSQKDICLSLKTVVEDLAKGNEQGDQAALAVLTDFGRRQLERNKKMEENVASTAKSSDLSQVFSESVVLEDKVVDEFKKVQDKYGLNISEDNDEATVGSRVQ